jgi:hypothetical protein
MADKGKLDVITRLNKWLSKRGKGKNKKENQRRSPPSDLLLEAARIGHVEAVKTLLEAGADNRVLTRGVTHPRRPATRGLFPNPGHDPRTLRNRCVNAGQIGLHRRRMCAGGQHLFLLWEGRRGKKKKKSRVKLAKGQVAAQEALVQKCKLSANPLCAPVKSSDHFFLSEKRSRCCSCSPCFAP